MRVVTVRLLSRMDQDARRTNLRKHLRPEGRERHLPRLHADHNRERVEEVDLTQTGSRVSAEESRTEEKANPLTWGRGLTCGNSTEKCVLRTYLVHSHCCFADGILVYSAYVTSAGDDDAKAVHAKKVRGRRRLTSCSLYCLNHPM